MWVECGSLKDQLRLAKRNPHHLAFTSSSICESVLEYDNNVKLKGGRECDTTKFEVILYIRLYIADSGHIVFGGSQSRKQIAGTIYGGRYKPIADFIKINLIFLFFIKIIYLFEKKNKFEKKNH